MALGVVIEHWVLGDACKDALEGLGSCLTLIMSDSDQ